MSPVTSLAKPFARPNTQCPYCDHVSPVGSKFCGECGAALHLMPCPHCGAVNDITLTTACYRCHGELRKSVSAALPASADTVSATTVSATTVSATAARAATAPVEPETRQPDISPYVIAGPPSRQRPHALVVAIVLIAFGAASYYAFRQRSTLDLREPVRAEVKGPGAPAETNGNAGAGTIVKAPADAVPHAATAPAAAAEKGIAAGITGGVPVEVKALKPDAAPPRDAAATTPIATTATTRAPRSIPGKSASAREPAASPATATVVVPEGTRARFEAGKGLEKQLPNIGPCTDAVAALGLCTPEPIPRRQ